MKKENLEAITRSKKNKKDKFNFKKYIRDFILFIDNKLLRTIGILLVVAVLLVAISLKPIANTIVVQECVGTCSDGATLLGDYFSKLQVLLVTLVAGIVPYMYAPIIGLVGSVLTEVVTLSYTIKGYGYLLGILLGIVPALLNILTVSIVVALGIYVCKTVTVGYKISSTKNMNFTNFKIRLYEVMKKEGKVKKLTEKRDSKIQKLESKKEKINYLQILNTSILVCIIQFIATLIQHIVM